jgi:hypothetical protein
MARPTAKSTYWIIFLGLLSLAVLAVMALLAYLLLSLPTPSADQMTPTATRPALSLPTAPIPTSTPGPPPSVEDAVFAVQKPIKGTADCDTSGFKGIVSSSNGDRLAGLQVTVWEEGVGLLAIDTTNDEGIYTIEMKDKPARRKFWVQVYQNDVPASEPLSVETQADCQKGFQIYQINWRGKEEE